MAVQRVFCVFCGFCVSPFSYAWRVAYWRATCCYMLLHGNSAKRTCSIRCSKMEENGRKWKLDARVGMD